MIDSSVRLQLRLRYPSNLDIAAHCYRHAVREAVAEQLERPLSGPIGVFVSVKMPDQRNRNLENVLGVIFDALGHCGAWDAEAEVTTVQIERVAGLGGWLVVSVFEDRRYLAELAMLELDE